MELDLSEDDFIVSKTDTRGIITYGNAIFIKMSGYSEAELLGSPHNILRHEDMPRTIFKLLWDRIKQKRPLNAYVKNRTKNGDYYWVFANVTTSLNAAGEIVGFYSVRRKASETGKQQIAALYQQLLDAEKTRGMDAAQALLEAAYTEQGQSYDSYILSLQK